MSTPTARSVSAFNSELKLRGFKAFRIEEDGAATRVYSRKDFYKICLTTGRSFIHYASRSFEQKGTVLFFGNPHIPYSWETRSRTYTGYTCLFSERFLQLSERSEAVLQSPLFRLGGTPVLTIDPGRCDFLAAIFQKMIDEQETDYPYKDELIRNYIQLIVHEALKLHPVANPADPVGNAASRLTAVFLELLERQFPVETPDRPLELKSPQDYAHQLSVHVNHLNSSVKSVTGKTTSAHISDRIVAEARALLEHTDWNISAIGYALGFDYPTYFSNFFKKLTGQSPRAVRKSLL
ncbi:AraC-like DNA-binding protein [Lewinella marina]|uniref:AraC family transcriptional regulator n=1 Tax=Neolewinella marina TaxID=438751 RepID=A0A2G0CAY8_9BACT|nr:helix-turn-helix transcriptional regulator [Neolewinella marina]NJB84267.1 AraC-like DNA-binding protein [Neolewinella marina]PHK97149.1 AraC family transcriptional regulator [Neolewinella marina]